MADDPALAERGVLTASEEAWGLAVRQAEVIRELAAQRVVSLQDADAAASRLCVSRRQVYVLVSRWRAGGGIVSDLLPATG
jgi:putative transposase